MYHSSRNDLCSMSSSRNLFKLSKHIMHSLRKRSWISETCQTEHTKHTKWNKAGCCSVKGRAITIGTYQQSHEASRSVDPGSERPNRDSQLEIFPIAHSLESHSSDRLSSLTFTLLRNPISNKNNTEKHTFSLHILLGWLLVGVCFFLFVCLFFCLFVFVSLWGFLLFVGLQMC